MTKVLHAILLMSLLPLNHTLAASTAANDRPTTPGLVARRIVSLAPQATETIFALGEGDRLLAVSTSSRWPDEAREKPQVGGILDPQIEQITGMNPDLVILSKNHILHMRALRQRDIPTLTVSTESIDEAMWMIHDLSYIVEQPQKAKALLEDMVGQLNTLARQYETARPPRALICIYHDSAPFKEVLVVARDNYIDEILRTAGGINAVTHREPEGGLSVRLTDNDILSLKPQVILDLMPEELSDEERQAIELRWKQLAPQAVIHVTHEPYLGVPGVRIPESVQMLAKLIHQSSTRPQTHPATAASAPVE